MCLDSTLSQLQELNSAINASPGNGQKFVEEAVRITSNKVPELVNAFLLFDKS